MKFWIQAAAIAALGWTAACSESPSETVETWLATASQEAWTAAQQAQASAVAAEHHSEYEQSIRKTATAEVADVFNAARVPPLQVDNANAAAVESDAPAASSAMLPENEAAAASGLSDAEPKRAGGVRYVGFIQSDKNIKALLEIGGTVYPVRQGDAVQAAGINVLRIRREAVWIAQAGKRRELRLDKAGGAVRQPETFNFQAASVTGKNN